MQYLMQQHSAGVANLFLRERAVYFFKHGAGRIIVFIKHGVGHYRSTVQIPKLVTICWYFYTCSNIVILYQEYLLGIHLFQAHLQRHKGLQREEIRFSIEWKYVDCLSQ